MPATRRALLASAATAFTGVAGCLSTGPGGDSPTTRTTETTPATTGSRTSTTPGPVDVSFVGHAVQRSAFWYLHPDFTSVWDAPDSQLLFAMVVVEGGSSGDLSFDDFSLRVGNREVDYSSSVEDSDGDTSYPFPTTCDCRAEYGTYATFPLPAPLSADECEVRWDGPAGTTWSLPESALSALSAPTTRFELASFDAPDSVRTGESFEVGYEVENAGSAAGTVRAVLNEEGPVYGELDRVEERVDAGGSTVRRVTVDQPGGSDASGIKLRLRTVGGDADHTVAVDGAPSGGGGTSTTSTAQNDDRPTP